MNYTLAGGGSSLTYPILQTTIDLSGANFTKLNTAPITLIATDNTNYICVVNQFCQYKNANMDLISFILVGFEPILSSAPNSCSLSLYGANIQGTEGMLNYINLTYGAPNSLHNSPLVLWSAADDASASFPEFYLTINYCLIPKLIT